jgi:hypothetical protein
VFHFGVEPATDPEQGKKLVKDHHINVEQISDCWTCHR